MKSFRSPLTAPTYAEARLRLGILGVGTFVVLSLLALAIGLPGRIFGIAGGGLFTNASLLAVWLAGVSAVALPFEILGGYVLPNKFGRRETEFGDWLVAWLRGVLVIVLTMSLSGALLILAGKYAGRVGALGMLGVLSVVLAGVQVWMARLVGSLRSVRPELDRIENELRQLGVVVPPLTVLESEDVGFTGGIAGFPTAERLVLPKHWIERLEPSAVALLIARRTLIVDRGLRALGLGGAIAWSLFAFAGASILPGAGVASVTGLVGTSLWFTVLSFLGLLILPTPSRAGALAADALTAIHHPGNGEQLAETLKTLDTLQDDEPDRPPAVERIFHPIPSVTSRREALVAPNSEMAPWHIARTALYISIAGMSPLSRLVHCNVGRPDLWVFLPSDG